MSELYSAEERAADAARDPMERIRVMEHGRARLSEVQEWIGEEFARIERELAHLRAIRVDRKQPKVFLERPDEVLSALKLGVISKAEARSIMGLKKIRQPAALRRAREGK